MKNANKVMSEQELNDLSCRIASLEERTDAEVVCAVATESGRYDRAESVCGLFLGVLALIIAQMVHAKNHWDVAEALPIGWQVFGIALGFVAGSMLSSYWHGLRGLLVSRAETKSEVQRSMHAIFSSHGIGGTRHHGGLLIYLSLFEHRLEVHGDCSLLEKVTVEELEAIRDAVLDQVRAGRIADGLAAGLHVAEDLLARVLPYSEAVKDELPNEVLVFHPRP